MHPRIFRLFFITILLVSGCIFPYSLVYKQKLLHVSVKTPLLMQCCPEALVNGLSRLLVDTEAAVTHRKYFFKWNNNIIRCKFFFLFIGGEPTM